MKAPCMRCNSKNLKRRKGKGPHASELYCSDCGAHARWLKDPNGTLQTLDELKGRETNILKKGYESPKWLLFCIYLIKKHGFTIYLYEPKDSKSRYVRVINGNKVFKVRFSNHPPNKRREVKGDCDFFVGVTHTGARTTRDAYFSLLDYMYGEGA